MKRDGKNGLVWEFMAMNVVNNLVWVDVVTFAKICIGGFRRNLKESVTKRSFESNPVSS